jgi:hypothetical protein
MEGFVVLSQTEEDGELWVLVETTADVAGRPSCGVRATGHGRRGRNLTGNRGRSTSSARMTFRSSRV